MSAKHEHYDVIRKPIITEKANEWLPDTTRRFRSPIDSNKPQ